MTSRFTCARGGAATRPGAAGVAAGKFGAVVFGAAPHPAWRASGWRVELLGYGCEHWRGRAIRELLRADDPAAAFAARCRAYYLAVRADPG